MKTKRITWTKLKIWKSKKDKLWYLTGFRKNDIVMDGGEGRKRRCDVVRGLTNLIQSFKDDHYTIVLE
jgi:hypothetical protein